MFDDETERQNIPIKPPEAVDSLVKMLERSRRNIPKMFPSDLTTMAKHWISLQEPPNEFTERVTPIKKGNEITGWNTPYHDRLIFRLRKFLSLKHIHQVFVIDMIENGIAWRGENIDFCKIMIEYERT